MNDNLKTQVQFQVANSKVSKKNVNETYELHINTCLTYLLAITSILFSPSNLLYDSYINDIYVK